MIIGGGQKGEIGKDWNVNYIYLYNLDKSLVLIQYSSQNDIVQGLVHPKFEIHDIRLNRKEGAIEKSFKHFLEVYISIRKPTCRGVIIR